MANDQLISLEAAHEILGTFGISPYSHEYQRWRRDDGFILTDLIRILNESGLVLIVDWRELLQDATDLINQQLATVKIIARADLDPDGTDGEFTVGDASVSIKFVPADEDDFDAVIVAINSLIKSLAHYKKFRSCVGSDGWAYALLKNDDWQAIQTSAPGSLDRIFKEVSEH